MQTLWHDLRYGARVLVKKPGFTLVAIITLALSIGANTAIFSMVNAVLLRQLPFEQPDQLVHVWSVANARLRAPFNLSDFCDYRDQTQSLKLVALSYWNGNLTGDGEPERVQGVRISADAFQVLGVKSLVGRTLMPPDDLPGNQRVVLLSHGFWQRRFGAELRAVGQRLTLNGTSYEVVGVLPPDFIFPNLAEVEFAIPLAPDADPARHVPASVSYLRLLARLKPGVAQPQAEAEMNAIADQLRQKYPEANGNKTGVKLFSLYDGIVGNYRRALWVLFGAVALVLLIACANLANLLLVRGAGRHKEMAIRSALGATRYMLIRQLLIESMLLALAGTLLGLLVAVWGGELLLKLSPTSLPRTNEVGIDGNVLAFTIGVSLLSGLLFGLAPAWHSSRADFNHGLKEGGKGTAGGAGHNRVRSLLVMAEVALALVLLVGAGLFIRSLQKVQEVKPGFDMGNLLLLRVALPQNTYPDRDALTRFYEQAASRLEQLPGVESLAVTNILPLSGLSSSVEFTVVGRPPASREQTPRTQYRIASPDYFRTLGIPLTAGRDFTEWDAASSPPVLIINQRLAQSFFSDRNPIGEHLTIDDNDQGPRALEIVGVVGDVKQFGPEGDSTFDIYLPLRQAHTDTVPLLRTSLSWVIRSTTDPLALSTAVRREFQAVDRDVPASGIKTMEQALAVTLAPRRFNLFLLSIFAAVALLLAATGIYAVVAYSVTQRTQEIGIRLALGAQRSGVLRLVFGQSMKPALIGVGIGLVAAFALTRLMASLLFDVSATDPATFALIALLLTGVVLLACYFPARRATSVDPMVALRHE